MTAGAGAPVALVTGGAVRVGRAIALGLADAGYDLVINYHSSGAEAREVERRVRGMGRRVRVAPGDVSDAGDVEEIAGTVEREFGRLDLLVNNASLFDQGALLDVEEEDWDRVMGVNVKGPFLLVQKTAELLAGSKGSVVNLVDLSAFQPWVSFPHHSVSKAGLLQLTRVAARSLAPHVRVNAIAPGAVLPPEDYTEEQRERSRTQTALGTLGAPEDVVRTVLYLARSPFVTGEVVVLDGGRMLGS